MDRKVDEEALPFGGELREEGEQGRRRGRMGGQASSLLRERRRWWGRSRRRRRGLFRIGGVAVVASGSGRRGRRGRGRVRRKQALERLLRHRDAHVLTPQQEPRPILVPIRRLHHLPPRVPEPFLDPPSFRPTSTSSSSSPSHESDTPHRDLDPGESRPRLRFPSEVVHRREAKVPYFEIAREEPGPESEGEEVVQSEGDEDEEDCAAQEERGQVVGEPCCGCWRSGRRRRGEEDVRQPQQQVRHRRELTTTTLGFSDPACGF